MQLRCIAIDDEPYALGIISEYCSRIGFLKLLKSFTSGVEAIEYIKNSPVDLIFLDIQMRDISGIQLMDILKPMPKVILTTAFNDYAVQSYEYNVTDYLLKPIAFDRFLKAVTKCMETTEQTGEVKNNKTAEKPDHLFLKSGYSIVRIDFADIYYIEGQKDYLMVRTEKDKILTLQSFLQFMEILPALDFLRVHKSYIVSLKKINKIERNRIRMLDAFIPIGDSYKDEFMRALKGRMLG